MSGLSCQAVVSDAGAATSPITISVGGGSVVEGDIGNRILAVPVTLSAPSTTAISIGFAVTPSTQTAGGPSTSSDFRTRSGTLKFVPLASTGLTPVQKNIAVTVYGDTMDEGDDTFAVVINNEVGPAAILDAVGTGTIVDDDPGNDVRISAGDRSSHQTLPDVFFVCAR